MATFVTCDRCGQKIEGAPHKLSYSFNKEHWDLCGRCFGAFERFMGDKTKELERIEKGQDRNEFNI